MGHDHLLTMLDKQIYLHAPAGEGRERLTQKAELHFCDRDPRNAPVTGPVRIAGLLLVQRTRRSTE